VHYENSNNDNLLRETDHVFHGTLLINKQKENELKKLVFQGVSR